jgi:hypothetical protein
VFKLIEVDALRSIGRNVVVTMLTGKLSLDFGLLLGIADSGVRSLH